MATITKYGKILFSDNEIQFIKDNFATMTNQQIADRLGLKKTRVRMKAYELGLQRMQLEYWPVDAVDFLKSNYKLMGNLEIVRYFTIHFPKTKGWTTSHIDKKLEQLALKRNKQDFYNITERNRQNGSYGTPNPKLKRKPMPKIWLKLDAKTIVEVKPGQCEKDIITKYQNRHEHLKKR